MGHFLPNENGWTNGITDKVWEGRKFNVAWEASHCNTSSGRELYAAALAKHIDVTIYGKCGTKRNTCTQTENSVRSSRCYKEISHNFKFFLVFENSLCTDYVTEKLWRTYDLNLVPIVYGQYNYKAHLPEKSYIDVMDFSSPKQLADHLYKVASNKTLYDSYMYWRKSQRAVMDPYKDSMCQLCDYLHKTRENPKRTVNLAEYWSEESNCISSYNFLHSVGVI